MGDGVAQVAHQHPCLGQQRLVAPFPGLAEQQRQGRRGGRLVGVHAQQRGKVTVGGDLAGPLAADRVAVLDGLEAAGLQLPAYAGQVLGRVAQVVRAGGVVAAALEQHLQRVLQVDRVLGAQGQVVGHDRVQQHRARVRRIGRGVLLGDAGAVGNADQVQFRRAHLPAHQLQVADVVGGAVEPQVGVLRQLFAARLREAAGRLHAVVLRVGEGVVAFLVPTGEQVRAAGAARIHQQYVAVAQDVAEGAMQQRVGLQRRLPGAAGDHHHRVGQRVAAGFHPRHRQFDPAAVGLPVVLGHLDVRAACLDGVAHGAAERAGFEGDVTQAHGRGVPNRCRVGRRRVAAGERQRQQACRAGQAKVSSHQESSGVEVRAPPAPKYSDVY